VKNIKQVKYKDVVKYKKSNYLQFIGVMQCTCKSVCVLKVGGVCVAPDPKCDTL
jgi:hypothetical protein